MRVINSHLSVEPFSPVVDGVVPTAAWVPSRDSAGRFTSTLVDLSGNGNNATLTNMDPATDWVSDSGAGGKRAIELDGVNDHATFTAIPIANGIGGNQYASTLSLWFKTSSSAAQRLFGSTSSNLIGVTIESATSIAVGSAAFTVPSLNDSAWHHIAATFPANGVVGLHFDGVDLGTGAVATTTAVTSINALGRRAAGQYFSGRLDDIRIFSQAEDAAFVALLYGGGSGRGKTTA